MLYRQNYIFGQFFFQTRKTHPELPDGICATQLRLSHDAARVVYIRSATDYSRLYGSSAVDRFNPADQSTRNQGASPLSRAMALNVAHRRGFRWPIPLVNTRFLPDQSAYFCRATNWQARL